VGLLPSPVTLLCLTAVLITAYLLNQIFDRESDERNNKCFYLSRGIFRVRTLVFMSLFFFLAASYAYHRTGEPQRIPLFLALALALLYSLPPVRLCSRPFLDMIANAVGYGGVAFVLGFRALNSSGTDAVWLCVPYVLLVAATFLHTTILDIDGDRAASKISTSVLIGVDGSIVLAAVIHATAFILAILTGRPMAIIVTGGSLPFTVYSIFKRTGRVSAFLIQANTLIVTVAAAVLWPVYLGALVPLILLSRFYHKKRFGIPYPGPG
jgi:4-hydroxybenzoate polyprenyltransferase